MGSHALLTRREAEVLAHVRTGASTAQVARTLSIAPSTVKTHIESICSKTSAQSRIELVTPESEVPADELALRYGLSERQVEVVVLLLRGLTNRQIARELWLAVDTVKEHLQNIYGLLEVRTRYEAVARIRRDAAVEAATRA